MFAKFFNVTVAIVFVSITVPASAVVIVDTGSPEFTSNGALSVLPSQWVGININLLNSYQLTDIKSYFYVPSNSDGTLTASIFTQTAGLPGLELYSQEFSISNFAPGIGIKDWFGPNELDWKVGPGSYWLTYEVKDSQTFSGALEFPAPHLLSVAVKNDILSNWTILPGHGFGLMLQGNVISTVPEPSTYTLTLGGLALLVLSRVMVLRLSSTSTIFYWQHSFPNPGNIRYQLATGNSFQSPV